MGIMKAVIRKVYGSPDVLEVTDVEKPVPAAGEVLVRIHATSVNASDWELLSVEATASSSQLKSAYRRMLKRWHPDLFPSDSASYSEAIRQTQRINDAYRLLDGNGGRQMLQWDLAQTNSVTVWNGGWDRSRYWRSKANVILVSVAIYVGLSWFFHEVVLGL